jgi:hypothetical protein
MARLVVRSKSIIQFRISPFALADAVIPAKAGIHGLTFRSKYWLSFFIQFRTMDSRFRGNDNFGVVNLNA